MAHGMHPEDIAAAIRKRGVSLKELSLRHGYSRSAVQMTIRYRSWSHIERIIADFIGVPPEKIWPARYTRDGQPLARRRAHREHRAPETR